MELCSKTPGALPPRRTACDRCRSHKLRCIRDREDTETEVCRRCLRAGITCLTNATAQIGKPTGVHRRQIDKRQQSGHGLRRVRSSMSRVAEQEPQVPTPASTTVNDITSSDLTVSEIGDHDNVLQSMLSHSAITPDRAIHSNSGPGVNVNSLNHVSVSFDVLDPAQIPALPPPLNVREECVRKLAGLHSTLVLDLDMARACQTADRCTAIINMPEFSQNYNFMIGRMLSSSTKLVEILEYFVPPLKQDMLQAVVRCDTPTVLSILTCYTYLTRIYRIVLVSIHKSLLNPPPPPEKLPAIFPGLQLGGYSLEPHLDLQVKILVQVSEERLARIDSLMGLSSERGKGTGPGLLKHDRASIRLLEDMLEKELTETHDEGMLIGNQIPLIDILQQLKDI